MISTRHTWAIAWLAVVTSVGACKPTTNPAPFPLQVSVSTTTGMPVAAASILIDGKAAGSTDSSGELDINSSAAEGTVITLTVTCPIGYENTSGAAPIALRRLATLDETNAPAALRPRLICNPTEISSVIVVSVREPNLPILINGALQTTTNHDGIAHVLLRGKPATSFELKLDTRTRPELHPQNPTRTFTLNKTAELLSFQQPLKAEKKPRARRATKTTARVPYRMD